MLQKLSKCEVNSLWEFQDLSVNVIQILHEIKVQKGHFCHFRGSEFYWFGQLVNAKIHKKQNSEPLNVLKQLILHFKNPQKLISRKIWLIEKLCNFHTVHVL